MKTIELNSNIRLFTAQSDLANPFLTTVKFVFADDLPNMNGQGIPYEEFSTLASSAIGMPIKVRFFGNGIGGHTGAVPVGHIQNVLEEEEDGIHRLVAEGVLYNDEYPDIIEYLKEAFDKAQKNEGETPGVSWEISYKDSFVDKGIEWLKGVIARAATFVKHPAYGTRTALLALASDKTLSDEDIEKELVGLAKGIAQSHEQGGTNKVELEQALAKIEELEAQIAEQKTALAEAEASKETFTSENETLQAQINELTSKVASFEKALLIETRVKKLEEAGVPIPAEAEELAKKQEFWIAMSEEMFEEYVSDLAAVAKKTPDKKSEASANFLQLPKISVDTTANSGAVSAESLRFKMRNLSRNETAE